MPHSDIQIEFIVKKFDNYFSELAKNLQKGHFVVEGVAVKTPFKKFKNAGREHHT